MSTLKEICKEQTEMIDEMRQNIKELTEENEKLSEQYNKMIAERNSLIDDLPWYKAKVSRLERENEDLKFTKKMHLGYIKYFSNNNELLRDEVKSLKQENKQLKESRYWDYEYIIKVNEENKRLEDEKGDYKAKYIIAKLHLKDVKDENILKNNLLSEFSQHIGNKPSSSTYKYFRGKLNALDIREGE